MYEIKKENYEGDNIYAGDFPVEIEVVEAKENIGKNTVVALTAGKLSKITAENLGDIYGITVDEAKANEKVAVYLTGDFRADALDYGTATVDKVKAPLRKISIFIK